MLIACPSCASEYTIDPAYVRPQGRTVRCASCRGTFFVAPADGAGSLAPAEPSVLLPGALDGESPPSLTVDAQSGRGAPEPAGKELRTLRRPPKRAGHLFARVPKGPLLGLLALSLVALAALDRTRLVEAYPETARLYEAVGLPVNLRGADFRSVTSQLALSDSGTSLVVEGEITNPTAREIVLPPIAIAVRGADEEALYTWRHDPPRRTLGPGEATRFRARLAAPPPEGRQVLVRFARRSETVAVARHDP